MGDADVAEKWPLFFEVVRAVFSGDVGGVDSSVALDMQPILPWCHNFKILVGTHDPQRADFRNF